MQQFSAGKLYTQQLKNMDYGVKLQILQMYMCYIHNLGSKNLQLTKLIMIKLNYSIISLKGKKSTNIKPWGNSTQDTEEAIKPPFTK